MELESIVASVAAYGLPVESRWPPEPLSDDRFLVLVGRCGHDRVLGLLGEAVRAEVFPVTDTQWAELEASLGAWLAHALRVERMLLGAVEALGGAGIESRVLKGVALAHSAYPAPEWRVFGDADLLVPAASLGPAAATLCDALDATREVPELRPGFDERFGKEVLLRVGNLELDLHRMFEEGALGLTIDLGDLFAPGPTFPLGGRRLAMLPPAQQLMHAAYAALLGDVPPRLMSVRDLAQVLAVHAPDADEVRAMARRWCAEAVLARALTLTWSTLGLRDRPALVRWADSYVPGRRERAILEAHLAPNRAHARHLAALRVLPGLADRAAYLRALAWPQRSYLEARGFTRGSFVHRAGRSLRPRA